MHLVDTSVWIEFLRRRGSPKIQTELQPLIRSGSIALTEWIILEMMAGISSTENSGALLGRLAPVHRLALTDAGWNRAWSMAARLRKKGVSSSAADCLIATVAVLHDVPLIHCDSDFSRIAAHEPLKTLDWTTYLAADKRAKG